MNEKKQKARIRVPYTIRDKAEIAVLVILIGGGFVGILHFTSPSIHHSTLGKWWTPTSSRSWSKVHTSVFDEFTQEDFGDDLVEEDEYVDITETDQYHVESLAGKLKGENFEQIEILDKKINYPKWSDGKDKQFVEDFQIFKDVENNSPEHPVSAKLCEVVSENERFDCHPEKRANEIACLERGCCWHREEDSSRNSSNVKLGVPSCYYPKNYKGYTVKKSSRRENDKGFIDFMIDLVKDKPSHYPNDTMKVLMEIIYETDYRLRIKISDPNKTRWEVPTTGAKIPSRSLTSDYMYSFQSPVPGDPFFLTVTRESTNTTILNTTEGFLFSDQFLQLSYLLPPSSSLYGLGEHRDTLRHSYKWTRYVFWNKDQPPVEDSNLYGSHPFYLVMEEDGNSHGVLLLNSNAMEAILQPAPAITWRTIGGLLDFYVFFGPTPGDVIRQYTELIGRPFLPPYWSLGYHQCRWGYTTAEKTQAIADNLTRAGMPQDVQWNDADYMEEMRDFTTSPAYGDQGALVTKLHNQGKHYMMIVDPGISNSKPGSYQPYDLGLSMNIFINNTDDKPLVGKVWPGSTVFPDFTNPRTTQYWTKLVTGFHDNVQFDGMWIDMNEISNFVAGAINGCSLKDRYETPPYVPGVKGDTLRFSTICASAKQHLSRTYDVHNLYGLGESNASFSAMLEARPNRRPLLISRSTFPGQGQFGGHWTGDNAATFYDMYKSISDILSFNMFGIPMVGADICGFRETPTKELCQRWFQLGAFYPFSRSHNAQGLPDQDPTAFGEDLLQSTITAYTMRYSLLPFLYTLFLNSHREGDTVARPLFFEYPYDKATYGIDKQFLWGPSLMILAVLDEDILVEAYFPADTWYSFNTGALITNTGGTKTLPAPLNTINLAVRGGYILPMQDPALSTPFSRKNQFRLLVALNQSMAAQGELYWDDGDSLDSYNSGSYNWIEFTATNQSVTNTVVHSGYPSEVMSLGNVTILGVPSQPHNVTVYGVTTKFTYDTNNKVLYIPSLLVDLLKKFTLIWT